MAVEQMQAAGILMPLEKTGRERLYRAHEVIRRLDQPSG
jgi:hypothetical protein